MTLEQLNAIQTIAEELLGEIEWMDLPESPAGFRGWMTEFLGMSSFIDLARSYLVLISISLRSSNPNCIIGHQEPELEAELEAVGLVQAVVKRTLVSVVVSSTIQEKVYALPLLIKFRRWPHPFVQAATNERVASLAEQMSQAVGEFNN